MGIAANKRSSFYYGHTITASNNIFSFDEGAAELQATISIGEYSLETFATALALAMTTAGTQTYAASVARSTRIITISATSNFSLLVSSGANVGTYSLIGFSGSDKTGTNSYSGSSGSGSEYLPQFYLQKYIGTAHYKEAVDASINESGSGEIQVISYGTRQFMECNVRYTTNIDQGDSGVIETNLTGVDDLVTFMDNIVGKTKIEFMEDRDTPNTYETFILESTSTSKNGTGYRLKELYGEKLAGYYDSGTLKFRKI